MATSRIAKAGRFTVSEHDTGRAVHWDLFVEGPGSRLATWSLDAAPWSHAGPVRAVEKPPHRPAYLEYEGPISGSRGEVRIRDRGTFRGVEGADGERASVALELSGERTRGEFRLRETGETTPDGDREWIFEATPPLYGLPS